MKKISVNDWLIKLLYLLSTTIIVFQLFGQNNLVSASFYLTFILAVGLWIVNLTRWVDWLDILVVLIIVIAGMNILINSVIERSVIDFSYLKKYITFSITIMFLRFSEKIRLTDGQKKFIGNCVDFITIFFIVCFLLKGNDLYYLEGRISPYLTFKFTNPNLTGLFLVCFIVTEMLLLIDEKTKKRRVYRILLLMFLFYFILKTQARASILATIFLFVFSLFVIFSKKKMFRLNKWYAILFALSPAIFIYIYMYIMRNNKLLNMLSFFSTKGKELSSRENIWKNGINAFFESPIFGAYSQNSNGTGVFQLHNTHLDTISSYGVLVFVLVCILLYCFIYKKGRLCTKQDMICNIGFSTVIFMGLGEAALFSGGLCIYIFASIPLLFSECTWQKGYHV